VLPIFFDSFPSLLLVRVFVPFIHPYSFCSQLHSRFSSSISLSPSLLLSIAFRQYPALFPSVHFVLKLCRSLSHFHSQPGRLALFLHFTMYPGVSLSTYLRYFSCTLSTSSCSIHPQRSASYISTLSTMLSNIIIFLLNSPPHFLSAIPQTHSTTLFAQQLLHHRPLLMKLDIPSIQLNPPSLQN
jgi:hypothetical protein